MSDSQPSEWHSFLLFVLVPLVFGVVLVVFARTIRRKGLRNRRLNILIGNVLVFSFLGSLAFVGLEGWFRFFRDTTDSFNFSKTSRRWFQRHYFVNNMGMRDNILYGGRIAPGKRRITFVGDSFTVGQGIANVEDRFPNIMRRSMADTEVHVLAVAGFDTGPELDMLSDLVTNGYQVDIVILAYCLNDISDLVPQWQEALNRINEGRDTPGWLSRNSYFVNTMECRWKALSNPDIKDYYGGLKGAYNGPAWEKQKERLKAMQSLVASAHGKFGVMTFPFVNALGPNYQWDSVHKQLNAFWKDLGVPHEDLLSVYQGIAPSDLMVNKFDAHPNELAHRLAADAMVRFFQEPAVETSKDGRNPSR